MTRPELVEVLALLTSGVPSLDGRAIGRSGYAARGIASPSSSSFGFRPKQTEPEDLEDGDVDLDPA